MMISCWFHLWSWALNEKNPDSLVCLTSLKPQTESAVHKCLCRQPACKHVGIVMLPTEVRLKKKTAAQLVHCDSQSAITHGNPLTTTMIEILNFWPVDHKSQILGGACYTTHEWVLPHSHFLTLSAHGYSCLPTQRRTGACLWSGDGLILVVCCVELLLVDTNAKSHPRWPPAHPEHTCLALTQHCASTMCHHFNQERPGMSKVMFIPEW